MAVLPEELGNALKDRCDPLFLPGLTYEYAASGQVIGNGLILAFPGKERSGD